MSIRRVLCCGVAAVALAAGCAPPDVPAPEAPFAAGTWSTLHGDATNSKYIDVTVAESYTKKWSRLEGAALTVAPSVGPNGQIYQTTALPLGSSNLHAFDADGNVLWNSAPWTDANGLDSCAGFQTPIVDKQGDLYLSDCDQLWAYRPDGSVKWVVDLPSAPAGAPFQEVARPVPVNAFVTAAFTNDGSVLGVTMFGQVVVVNRHNGLLRAPVITLPGAIGTAVPPAPASLWTGGMLDPDIVEPLWQIAFAGSVVSANTPAVNVADGRVLVVATGAGPGDGALYALRFLPDSGQVVIEFATPVGAGSGSSPVLSNDREHVYVTDNDGVMYSVDSTTGEVEWTAQTTSLAQAVTTGPDGRIYIAGPRNMMAFEQDGALVWDVEFPSLAAGLPPLPASGPYALFSQPYGAPAGPMTLTNGSLVVPFNVNYDFTIPNTTTKVGVAVASKLVALDPETGAVQRVLASEVDSAGANTPVDAINDLILAPHSGFTSATAGLAPTVNSLLQPFGMSMVPVVGGLEAFEPVTP